MEPSSAGEFLEGFLEEAGEHLQNINQHLLRLEGLSQGSLDEPASVERLQLLSELFRSFHTLKGLSGMVGLADAAQLSHGLEALLQAVQRGSQELSPEVIDRFFTATSMLSAVIDTVRAPGQQKPDIQEELRALENLLNPKEEQRRDQEMPPGQEDQRDLSHLTVNDLLPGLDTHPDMVKGLGELERKKILTAARAGQAFALVVFMSSAERTARGENIDLARQLITEQGTLIKAVPSMSGGKIRFLFLVASATPLEAEKIIADEIIPLPVQLKAQPPGQVPPPAPGSPFVREIAREIAPSSVVRVDLARLDDLMVYTADIMLQQTRLGEILKDLGGTPVPVKRELAQTYQKLGRSLRDLRRAILRARMVPLAEAFNHMPLVVRDLARATQKEVNLEIQGEATEVDKLLVERLLDPLIHLVRNAVTHGIEMPAERARLGKPARGTLALRAVPEGEHIVIEVADDGRGIDLEGVAVKAARLGWWKAGQPLDAAEALRIITRPGFSTLGEADLAAGRGVGLDIVQRLVRSFGGTLGMETIARKGTTFRLRLPLTLVMVDVLFVRVGEERYALPRERIERIIEIDPAKIFHVEGGSLHAGEEVYYILHNMDDLVQTRQPAAVLADQKLPHARYGLVVSQDGWSENSPAGEINGRAAGGKNGAQRFLLVVDQVLDMREVVVHTVADPFLARPGIGGVTEMGDGRVVFILDIPSLLRQAHSSRVLFPAGLR